VLADRGLLDIADARAVDTVLARWQPWAVVNAAGFVRVDEAEHDPRHRRDNVLGPVTLARACNAHGLPLVTYSTDLVFDGRQEGPYIETDVPHPLNAYGQAKAECEQRVLACATQALVVRTAAFFGPWDPHNFVTRGLQALRRGERWKAAADQLVSPTYLHDLVTGSLDLLLDGEHGIWHLANPACLSWDAFARLVSEKAGLEPSRVDAVPGRTLGWVAPRPRQCALASAKGQVMPALEDAVQRYLAEVQPSLAA
jgi:dTDP-4-dehydrorhamnose reductase